MVDGAPLNTPSCSRHAVCAYWVMRLAGSTAQADGGCSHTSASTNQNRRSIMASVTHTLRRRTPEWPVDLISHRPVIFHRPRSLHVEQATPDGDDDRVRPVIGAQLVHQILDVEVDRGFGD